MRPALVALVALSLMLASCGGREEGSELAGYMEAKLVLVGAEEGGRIVALAAAEGDIVGESEMLFSLDSKVQEAELAAAQARQREAEAALELSRLSLERAKELRASGTTAQARLDDARAAYERDKASAEAAMAAFELARVRLERRQVKAPTTGSVEEVYFRPGEVVNAGQPVLALLPPANLRVRFYVPELSRARLKTGDAIAVTCDGCPAGLAATIVFIGREAEYTPPVIFSREERAKLVYPVEAEPIGRTRELTAGQPVTVHLGAARAAAAR